MRIIEVSDSHSRREFLKLPIRLYKNEKNWIRPLDKMYLNPPRTNTFVMANARAGSSLTIMKKR